MQSALCGTREPFWKALLFLECVEPLFLVCFGLIMLYSSSSYSALVKYNDSMYFLKRQVLFCGMGFFAMYWISQIDYHIYAKYAEKLYWFSIALLFLVRLTPLGKEVNGAKRWIRLPMNQQLQPAEIVKLAVILLIPIILCQLGNRAHKKDGIVKVIIWGFGAAAGVYFLTSNLSSAIIVAGITVCLLFVVHPKTKPFMVLAGSGLTAAIIAVAVYQTLQGLYAIGSGGFFGKGLGNSAQKMIIPEVQNDMILSVICEELGVCGVIIVLVLFGLLLYRLMFIAQNAPDMYGALVASGIFAHIAIQVILNIAVVTNTIPNTGVTLPFISYGGTSILFLMAEMGIALSISRQIRVEE